ncbi:hypothetical protein [Mycobacterium sp. E740]|uniref:hypothetical protein n=1 Tax=Mycobacterium sp. E740 TaxID=1834149 RepID=UPI0008014FE6|nr:hypothetical protein [Mycobacterium sp. E740]OBI78208.1 hypothetical protein A5663_20855 [Mycobacterium sp. E740]
MKTDIDALAELPLDQLEERVAFARARVEDRVQRCEAENRDMTSREADLTADDRHELGALRDAMALRSRNAEQSEKVARAVAEAVETRSAPWQPTLLVSEANLHAHAEALREGRPFGAVETRARVTAASDLGSAGAWATAAPNEPRHLIAFSGIPVSELTGRTAQVPHFTGPTATAGAGETADHPEYDAVDPVNLTALRYGRWSDVSALANVVDDLIGLNRMHSWGIARDLDAVAVDAVEAAGALNSLGVSAGEIEASVREAILLVAATCYVAETDVVVVGTPADLAELTAVTPGNAADLGSYAVRFNGARLYATTAASADMLTVFAPSAFRVFQSPLQSASLIDPQSGAHRFGSWVHSTSVAQEIAGSAVWVGGS